MSTHDEIKELFNSKAGGEALAAAETLKGFQDGSQKKLLLGLKEFDDHLPAGANNKMIFIGSRPSMGKTHNCEEVIQNLLDPNINGGLDVRILRLNLEMSTFDLFLRALKKELGVSLKEILSKPFSEDQSEAANRAYRSISNKKVTNVSKAYTGVDFDKLLGEFSSRFPNTQEGPNIHKIVLIDHLHIYPDKETIDSLMRIANEHKLADVNLTYVIYFQFNRTLEDSWRSTKNTAVNYKNVMPHSGHIYLTDALMQFADLVVGMVIPEVVDMEYYAAVHKKRNLHLINHFEEGHSELNFPRLKSFNRIFYNIIKRRMNDDFDTPRLYCRLLDEKRVETFSREKDDSDYPAPDLGGMDTGSILNTFFGLENDEFETPEDGEED